MENLKQKLREFKESLFVSAPVIVKKISDYETQRADVQLKIDHKDKEPPWILEVPIGHKESSTFSERELPEKGDVAWVVFTNRAIDKALESPEISTPNHDRVLDINDCYLAGDWSTDEGGVPESIGSMKKDDWLIGLHRDTQARVYMRASSGNIVLEPPPGRNTLELTEDPTYSVALFEKILIDYLSHTHGSAMGPTTSPITGLWTTDHGSDRVGVDD